MCYQVMRFSGLNTADETTQLQKQIKPREQKHIFGSETVHVGAVEFPTTFEHDTAVTALNESRFPRSNDFSDNASETAKDTSKTTWPLHGVLKMKKPNVSVEFTNEKSDFVQKNSYIQENRYIVNPTDHKIVGGIKKILKEELQSIIPKIQDTLFMEQKMSELKYKSKDKEPKFAEVSVVPCLSLDFVSQLDQDISTYLTRVYPKQICLKTYLTEEKFVRGSTKGLRVNETQSMDKANPSISLLNQHHIFVKDGSNMWEKVGHFRNEIPSQKRAELKQNKLVAINNNWKSP